MTLIERIAECLEFTHNAKKQNPNIQDIWYYLHDVPNEELFEYSKKICKIPVSSTTKDGGNCWSLHVSHTSPNIIFAFSVDGSVPFEGLDNVTHDPPIEEVKYSLGPFQAGYANEPTPPAPSSLTQQELDDLYGNENDRHQR